MRSISLVNLLAQCKGEPSVFGRDQVFLEDCDMPQQDVVEAGKIISRKMTGFGDFVPVFEDFHQRGFAGEKSCSERNKISARLDCELTSAEKMMLVSTTTRATFSPPQKQT